MELATDLIPYYAIYQSQIDYINKKNEGRDLDLYIGLLQIAKIELTVNSKEGEFKQTKWLEKSSSCHRDKSTGGSSWHFA